METMSLDAILDMRHGGAIGPAARTNDGLRRWVHWLKSPIEDSLYNPLLGYKRQSEWDDHSEAYDKTHYGPDLLVYVRVPAGAHEVSLYFNNKDGHSGENFRRDYLIEVYEKGTEGDRSRALARGRVVDFWNGVYKRFVIKDKGEYCFRIFRGESFSTILSGVFISKMCEAPEDDCAPRLSTMATFGGIVYRTVHGGLSFLRELTPQGVDANECLARKMYRDVARENREDESLDYLKWNLRIWDEEDRQEFRDSMLLAWTAQQLRDPSFREFKKNQLSPNVFNGDLATEDYNCKTSLTWLVRSDLCNKCQVPQSKVGDVCRAIRKRGVPDWEVE